MARTVVPGGGNNQVGVVVRGARACAGVREDARARADGPRIGTPDRRARDVAEWWGPWDC